MTINIEEDRKIVAKAKRNDSQTLEEHFERKADFHKHFNPIYVTELLDEVERLREENIELLESGLAQANIIKEQGEEIEALKAQMHDRNMRVAEAVRAACRVALEMARAETDAAVIERDWRSPSLEVSALNHRHSRAAVNCVNLEEVIKDA